MCITTNQSDTKFFSNPIPSPATIQHAIVSIQLNMLTCPTSTYPEIFKPDVVACFYYNLQPLSLSHCRSADRYEYAWCSECQTQSNRKKINGHVGRSIETD